MKINVFSKSIKLVKDFTKYFDRYPRIISFSFKGNEEFKTFIGGVISIGTFYSGRILKKNKTTAVNDLVNDSDPIDISESTFAFAFAIKGTDIDIAMDSSYINLQVNQFTNVKDTAGNGTKVNIPYQKCGDDFKFYNQTLVKKQGINNYYCPKSQNLSVMGNLYSDNYTYFEITIQRCYDEDNCKDDTILNSVLTTSYLQLALVNTYFDFDDYNSPVHTYLDDRFIYDFIPGLERENLVFIKQNEGELQDSIYRYSPDSDKVQFIGVDRVDSRISPEEKRGNLITVRFVKDPSQDTYERSVFSLLDLFGNLGGLNEILQVAGEIIVGVFASRLFIYSILSNLYQVDKSDFDKNSSIDSKIIKEVSNISKRSKNMNEQNINRQNKYRLNSNTIEDNKIKTVSVGLVFKIKL